MQKRRELSRLVRDWLLTNRNGRLTSDQWLNLVTEPLATLIWLSIPLIVLFAFTPVDDVLLYARYTRYLLPLFPLAVLYVMLMRARRYATIPVHYAVFYAGQNQGGAFRWFRRKMTVYTESGEPVQFDNFITNTAPRLEPDMPYLFYYLEEGKRLTMLSFAPVEHPEAENWRPSERFHERRRKRLS